VAAPQVQTIGNYAQVYIFEQTLTTNDGMRAVKWVAVTNMNFARDWIGLEQGGGEGALSAGQTPPDKDNEALDGSIASQLTGEGWTDITVTSDLETTSVTITVKALQAGKTNPDLKAACMAAAKQFLGQQSLTIPDDKITVNAQMK
jgi:hypothetical protein